MGDPDFDTPVPIVDAAVASLRAGCTHYTDYRGDLGLRQAIADYHLGITGQSVSPEQVLVQPGAQCALFSAALCLLEPGDEVIVPEPMYVTYEGFLGASGAEIVNVRLAAEDEFHLRAESIASAISPRTRAIFINSPHNPTGAIVPRETWDAVAELCRAHNLWLVLDEVYANLVYSGEHFSPCCLPGMGERTVTIGSLSKSHAMSGWRVGWLIGPPEMAAHGGNINMCMLYGSPGFIQDAAQLALTQPIPELNDMRLVYQQRRDSFYQVLKDAPGLQCLLPEAGMFVMIDIRPTGTNTKEFTERLLENHGVAVLAGDAFGPSAAGFIRCSLGLEEGELLRAAERIAACAASY